MSPTCCKCGNTAIPSDHGYFCPDCGSQAVYSEFPLGKDSKPVTMSTREFAEKMKALANSNDREEAHFKADKLVTLVLKQLGYAEGAEVYNSMTKWFS